MPHCGRCIWCGQSPGLVAIVAVAVVVVVVAVGRGRVNQRFQRGEQKGWESKEAVAKMKSKYDRG